MVAPASLTVSHAPSTTSQAPTPTGTCNLSGPIIQNGGFESGSLSPWSISTPVRGAVANGGIISPGSTLPGGGNYAFVASLTTPNAPYAGKVTLTLAQTLYTCTGAKYSLATDFKYISGSSCTFTMNGIALVPGNGWTRLVTTFVATANTDSVFFSFTCSTPGQFDVDNVNVTRISP